MANPKQKTPPTMSTVIDTPATEPVNVATAPVETPTNVIPMPGLALSADDATEVQRLQKEGEAIETDRKAAVAAIDEKYKPLLDEVQKEKAQVNVDFADRTNKNNAARKAIADRVLGAERARIDAQIKALKDQERALFGTVATAPRAAASGDSVPKGATTLKIMDVLTDTPQSIKEISDKSGVGYGSASNILRNLADTERATLSGTRSAPAYAKRYVAPAPVTS